ncbi:uncharacterized protein ACIQIH_004659 isoform 2-T4 [Cyanocitta cristata]
MRSDGDGGARAAAMAAAMALPAVTPAPAIWRQQQRRRFKRQPPPAAEAHGTRGFPVSAPAAQRQMAAVELGLQLPACTAPAGAQSQCLIDGKSEGDSLQNGQSTEETRLGTSVSSRLKASPVACSYRVPGNTDHSLCQLKTAWSTLLEAWDHGEGDRL